MSKEELIIKFCKLRNDNSKGFINMLKVTEYNCLLKWFNSELNRINCK